MCRYWLKKNKAYLKGKSSNEIAQLANQCFHQEIKKKITPAVRKLVLDHRMKGDYVVFLSAALQPLVDLWTFELEGDIGIGTYIAEIDGVMTGEIKGIHPYGIGKVHYVEEVVKDNGILIEESFGYGEHYSDRFFLEKVGNPIALHPDQKLLKYA